MNEEQRAYLSSELKAFDQLNPGSEVQPIADAYNRILAIAQAMMLSSDNPDAHARAWSLLNDDAYKDLAEVEEGKPNRLEDLKSKMNQVGELLLTTNG